MKIKNKIVNILLIITFLFLVIAPADVLATSTGDIYLSPASTSLTISNQLNLALRINPGTNINSVSATINFNPAYLTFVSSSTTGSAFDSCFPDSTTASSVTITCALLGGSVNTDSLVKTLTFNTITTGSTSLSISNSLTANNGTGYYPTDSGSTININAQPVSQAPAQPISTKINTYRPVTTPVVAQPTPTVSPSPIKLNLSSNLVNLYSLKSTINIKTTAKATFYIEYGLSKNSLSLTSNQTLPSDNTNISLINLSAKTTYYYQIFAIDSNNITQNFPISNFTTKGVSLTVQILSSNFQPVINKKIYLNSTSNYQVSGSNGKVTFYNQSPGNQTIFFFDNNHRFSQSVFVPSEVSEFSLLPQNQTIVISNLKLASNLAKPALAANLTIISLVVFYLGYMFYQVKFKK